LIFDGHSFVCDGVGLRSLPGFVEVGASPQNQSVLGDDLDLDRAALVLGLRDYLQKTGCAEVVLGLSGGIDSALVAALACEALGADAVYGLALPSRYSSARSVVDAERLAANLGMRLEKMPIEPAHQAIEAIAAGTFSTAGVCDENIQARLRGLLVMAVANAENRYALATGNKSELAVGYCTLYGDLCGALAPIGDLFKTDVFALSERFGEAVGGPIPATTSAAPPSAELRPDQRDDDSLPPYAILDPILRALIEDGADVAALIAAGHPPEAVYDAAARLRQSEYKRWQAPPVLRLSKKAFGNGRRIPLAQRGGLQ
jgi:NAD+ synthetase